MTTQEEDRTLGVFGNRMYDYCEQGIDKSDTDSAHGMSVDEDGDEADEFFEVAEDGSISSRSIASSTMPEQQPEQQPGSPVLQQQDVDAATQGKHAPRQSEISERQATGEDVPQVPMAGGGGVPCAHTSSSPQPLPGAARKIPIQGTSSSTPRGRMATNGAVDAWLASVAAASADADADDDVDMEDKAQEVREIEMRRRALMQEEVLRMRQIQRMRQAMVEEEERRIEMEKRKHRAMMLMEQELRRRRAAEEEEEKRRIKQQQLAYDALMERRRLEAALQAQQQMEEIMIMPHGCYYTPRPSRCSHGRRPFSALPSRSGIIDPWEPASLVALW